MSIEADGLEEVQGYVDRWWPVIGRYNAERFPVRARWMMKGPRDVGKIDALTSRVTESRWWWFTPAGQAIQYAGRVEPTHLNFPQLERELAP
jgi:hypothetical protein